MNIIYPWYINNVYFTYKSNIVNKYIKDFHLNNPSELYSFIKDYQPKH